MNDAMTARRQTSSQFQRRYSRGQATPPLVSPASEAVLIQSPRKQQSWIQRVKESDWWLWGEVIAFCGVLVALFAFWIDFNDRKLQRKALQTDLKDRELQREALQIDLEDRVLQREALKIDLEDRVTQRIAQAWELVTQVAPGNSGKGPALEYLNSQGISLRGINLSTERNQGQTSLSRVDLSGANLGEANLSEASLGGVNLSKALLLVANLSGANLQDSDLKGANLIKANLSGASFPRADLAGVSLDATNLTKAVFHEANLSGATLIEANLSEANFRKANMSNSILVNADLSGADFSSADLRGATFSSEYWGKFDDISREQLSHACGDQKTLLPEGLTIEPCSD